MFSGSNLSNNTSSINFDNNNDISYNIKNVSHLKDNSSNLINSLHENVLTNIDNPFGSNEWNSKIQNSFNGLNSPNQKSNDDIIPLKT